MADRERILARRAMFIAATMAGVATAGTGAAGGRGGSGGAQVGGSGGVAGFGAGGAGGEAGAGGRSPGAGGAQVCLSVEDDGAGGYPQPCLSMPKEETKGIVVHGCGCDIPRNVDDDMVFLIGLAAALAALRRRRP